MEAGVAKAAAATTRTHTVNDVWVIADIEAGVWAAWDKPPIINIIAAGDP